MVDKARAKEYLRIDEEDEDNFIGATRFVMKSYDMLKVA